MGTASEYPEMPDISQKALDSSGAYWEEKDLGSSHGIKKAPPLENLDQIQALQQVRVNFETSGEMGRDAWLPVQSCWAEMESELLLTGFHAVHV